jgi:hypothetical protein
MCDIEKVKALVIIAGKHWPFSSFELGSGSQVDEVSSHCPSAFS